MAAGVGCASRLMLAFVAGLAIAEEIRNHIPEAESPLPIGEANELPVDGVVVEIEGPIGGEIDLDGGIIGAMVDAMLAPILTRPPALHVGRGALGALDPITEGPFAMPMPFQHNPLFHRHGLFSPHSSLMRHPHVGHCHKDSHELCSRHLEGSGLIGMINTMRCLAESAHRVSDACRDTLVVTTLPCIGDMEAHCNTTDSLHTCFAESHKKFSADCHKTLKEASSHPAVVAKEATKDAEKRVMTIETKEATPAKPLSVENKEERKEEENNKAVEEAAPQEIPTASMFNSNLDLLESVKTTVRGNEMKLGVVLGALLVSVAALYMCTAGAKKTTRKERRSAIRFGRMRVETRPLGV
eukprot:CAMPEP_0170169680 /NCGR_PEP_ID=MMETSP0040_2-20121228/2615_1 /TAXON_ID=641309 /ORGANISM="Lotharella oceanica, Strain CCMP622" /LENGTH=354 /DNA_ID=CAMNT_0010408571 /DNA_START=11 /DNA_END=1075 /DNA_ORIENTATION=-